MLSHDDAAPAPDYDGLSKSLMEALTHNYGALADLQELAQRLVATDHQKHFGWVMDRVPIEQLRSV